MPSIVVANPFPVSSLIPEIHQLDPRLAVWQLYDPKVKAELSSAVIVTDDGTYLVDPVLLPCGSTENLVAERPTGIIVTNENHARETAALSKKLGVPVYAHKDAQPALQGLNVIPVAEGNAAVPGLEVIELKGGVRGEIALFDSVAGGTLLVGDALINFGSNGFALLPTKYCENQKQLRKSLRKLLPLEFSRMLFAHGTPILSNAQTRLARLLDAGH